jgi:hypothetical protein
LPPDLLPNHNPTESRRNYYVDPSRAELSSNIAAQSLAILRVLENFGTLKILVTVEPGGKTKMPLQQCSRFTEHPEDMISWKTHVMRPDLYAETD